MANPNIVAVTNILGGNLGWNLSATATTTLVTVDAEKILKINRITVANVDGSSAADVSLFVDYLQQEQVQQYTSQKQYQFQLTQR